MCKALPGLPPSTPSTSREVRDMAFEEIKRSGPRQGREGVGRPMDVAAFAGRTVDAYEDNRRHMGAEDARRVALILASSAQREESGLRGKEAGRFEGSAYKVGRSVLDTYDARIEEGFPAREARSEAVRVAAGFYNDRGEPRQPYGTLDVREFSARTIEEYRGRAAIDGARPARQSSTRYAAENVAVGNGVNYVRAGKLADASVNRYEAKVARGMEPDRARDETAREMAKRFDERAHDRERRTQRSRDGLSL